LMSGEIKVIVGKRMSVHRMGAMTAAALTGTSARHFSPM
jgi:hypothetical protein